LATTRTAPEFQHFEKEPIEFIERSRDESLGIEWLFASRRAECGGRTDRLKDGRAAFCVKTTDASGEKPPPRYLGSAAMVRRVSEAA
jgi:hypothetical protein